jgi:beta-mannosidase
MWCSLRRLAFFWLLSIAYAAAQQGAPTLSGWQMQDVAKVAEPGATVSLTTYQPAAWYKATVPGTVLTTLVDNKVYPDPLYGENMRQIPESLNKTSYWYRVGFAVPKANKGRHTWLHFAGINYAAEVWVNGRQVGTMRGAFARGDFDVSAEVKPGKPAELAVLVSPQPHPGVPHEHTVANGVGKNGGETALDGPTFLATIGWDWLPAVRDRDTGIWLPVTVDTTGPVVVRDPFVTSDLAASYQAAELTVSTELRNLEAKPVSGMLVGTISGHGPERTFRVPVTLDANADKTISLDSKAVPELHLEAPALWWPNGYGEPNLYKLALRFETGGKTTTISDAQEASFGIRKIAYEVADSENLTISVNGVRVMVRGGDWGLDDGLKRVSRKRLDAQFHMHQLANMNMIRNWVGQSTSPDFYEMADKYGILLWDEFFQANPFDGPDPADTATYLANVTDKVKRFRNHPAIAVWCARNEGYPPKDLDDSLKALMAKLDPTRLYQSNSADGRGVSSHGPYFWRSPRFFYRYDESFKTEVGSVSVPTIESIQGMMPERDWETIDDDWAQHDMAKGAQRGDEYPRGLAERYGHIRNLADFTRKAQLANYEAFRAMYEGRNANMFRTTTGILTWMSHPAQPSFVWQLYHYDLEPNASLFAVEKASEPVHVQLNELTNRVQVVNNRGAALNGLKVAVTLYRLDGRVYETQQRPVATVPASTTVDAGFVTIPTDMSQVFFVKLDLTGADGKLLSTNFYWQTVAQDDFRRLETLPVVTLDASAEQQVAGGNTVLTVTLRNGSASVALLGHLQLHRGAGDRVLPVMYSDNYVSLVPGESRTVTVTAATEDLEGAAPVLMVDGFNVEVRQAGGAVRIVNNVNAQPMHWPATQLVP